MADTRLFDLDQNVRASTFNRLEMLSVSAPDSSTHRHQSLTGLVALDQAFDPHHHHASTHYHLHHHQQQKRRHGHVHRSPAEVQNAAFDQTLHHEQQELRTAIRKHHAKAKKSVAQSKHFMSSIQHALKVNKKKQLKNKITSAVERIKIMTHKKIHVQVDSFKQHQTELRIEAEASAKDRHRLCRHNLLELGTRHDSIIRCRTPKIKEIMSYSQPHPPSDFKYSGGIRNDPADWHVWAPHLGVSTATSESFQIPRPPPPHPTASTAGSHPGSSNQKMSRAAHGTSPRRKLTTTSTLSKHKGRMDKKKRWEENKTLNCDDDNKNNASGQVENVEDSEKEDEHRDDTQDLDSNANQDNDEDEDELEHHESTHVERHEDLRKEKKHHRNHLFRMKSSDITDEDLKKGEKVVMVCVLLAESNRL